jgi:hypothetical protein
MITFRTGFINPQLENGPIATTYIKSIQAELGFAPSGTNPSKHYAIMEYFYNLSIDSANSFGILGSGELASIGYLVGFPWPSVFGAEFGNNFQFISEASFPGTNPSIGFSDATLGITYGTFTSAIPAQAGVYVSIPIYRQLLKFVAAIKWNGFTIPAIDLLMSNILNYLGLPLSNGYRILYVANNDISIVFNIANDNIGVGWLYVLQLAMNRVTTVPQVSLSIG